MAYLYFLLITHSLPAQGERISIFHRTLQHEDVLPMDNMKNSTNRVLRN